MIHPSWIALMNFCEKSPYCTIKKLEIKDGHPVFVIHEVVLYGETTAEVKTKLT